MFDSIKFTLASPRTDRTLRRRAKERPAEVTGSIPDAERDGRRGEAVGGNEDDDDATFARAGGPSPLGAAGLAGV